MSPRPQEPPSRATGRTLLVLLLVVGSAAGVYLSSLPGGFVWDDHNLIVENHWIKSWQNLRGVFTHDFFNRIGDEVSYGYYRPVVTATYVLDYAVWGLDAWGYHLTNLLLHAACSLLVALILLRLRFDLVATAVAGVLFAVHPIHTENVSWIAGRTDLVAFLFAALALLLHLLAWPPPPSPRPSQPEQLRKKKRQRKPHAEEPPPTPFRPNMLLILLSALTFAPALLAKEMSVVLIPWVGLIHLFHYRRSWLPAAISTAPYLVVTAGYGLMRFLFFDVDLPGTVMEHTPDAIILSLGPTVVRYLIWLIWRTDLNAYVKNPYVESLADPRLIPSWVVLGLIIWAVRRHRDRAHLLLMSTVLATSFIPIVNIVRISGPIDMGNVMAERFAYFPSFPFLSLIGLGVSWVWRGPTPTARGLRVPVTVILVAITGVFAVITWERSKEWHDEITFFRRTLEQNPDTSLILIRLAGAEIRAGELDAAGRSLERAQELTPDNTAVMSVLATLYVAKRQFDKAIPIQETVVDQVTLGRIRAINNLAFLYAASGREHKARELWEELVETDNSYAAVEYNLAEIYRSEGAYERARAGYQKALAERPQDRRYAYALATMERTLGRPAVALEIYRELLRLYPDDPAILNNVAAIYEEMGDLPRALTAYARVVELDPGYALARINYANALSRSGQDPEAEVQLRIVLDRSDDERMKRLAAERLALLRSRADPQPPAASGS